MAQIIITIHPTPGHAGMLRVADAMAQVLDLLRLHDDARRGVAMPEEGFEWRLESATTNSPLTITASAAPFDASANIDPYVNEVTRQLSNALTDLTVRGVSSWWMEPDTLVTANAFFARNKNGIALTTLESPGVEPIRVDAPTADAGMQTIAGVDVLRIDASTTEGEAWGEVRGVMMQAGVYAKAPAIRLLTPQYGQVWCRLSPTLAAEFGHATTLDEIWRGKTLAVEGRLIYKAGGKLSRIIASDVREVPDVPLVDIDSILDPNFTEGLDPVEYLRRLHEGELA